MTPGRYPHPGPARLALLARRSPGPSYSKLPQAAELAPVRLLSDTVVLIALRHLALPPYRAARSRADRR